ncbi:hypothetical protein [Microvirga terricola]|uniref:Uncharacterized protein n=1 Tax=Microvirga terricola TaxID=2719797 RepID=A0ABX0VFN2_9HYPH|nr:hypothetical protein [Microvirga terricola]NIX77780.1 hypothetical protein [Microvirga terricola]
MKNILPMLVIGGILAMMIYGSFKSDRPGRGSSAGDDFGGAGNSDGGGDGGGGSDGGGD